MDILGHVKIDGRFIFNGAPYIRWEHSDLTINRVTTNGYETFDSSHEGFPLVINSGGYKIRSDAAVYKGYDSGSGSCVNNRDHSGNGTMFQVDVYPISDVSEVTEATSYYKGH